jgi:hypothetical protein
MPRQPDPRPCPDPLFPDDVFIVSYPKSGSTWARFLLANYLTGNRCDFGSVSHHIPDLHYSPRIDPALPRPRLVKSHFPCDARYPRVINIVRDGRDVAVSYYYHALRYRRLDRATTFAAFLGAFNAGAVDDYGPWGAHVLSWLDREGADLLVMRYEDMTADPVAALVRMLRFIGHAVVPDAVASAVEASSFSRMQLVEEAQRDLIPQWSATEREIRFVRKGVAGEYRSHFDADAEAAFERRHGQALARLGYATTIAASA